MKIAIVHNDYGKFSGEEAVVRDHAELFRAHDCEVVFFRRSSAELHGLSGSVRGFLSGIRNPFSAKRFASFLDSEKPDVIHIHNLYPLISPCILPEAKKRGIPVVMTVHNFRLVCPNGLFSRSGQICEECAERHSVKPCLRGNCLNSRMKTLGYAFRTAVAQKNGWYINCVDRFLCLTEFQKNKLVHYGIPEEKCRIVPNFIDPGWLAKAEKTPCGSAGYVAYMGRLSEEKGIDLLLRSARELPEIPFRIAGNGAEKYREGAPSNVEFAGYLTGDAQFEFMRNARIQIMASRWYEIFPTALLQGMSLGIPALVPNLGGMPGIIRGAGEAFAPGSMTETIRLLWSDPAKLETYRSGALLRIRDFSPETCWILLDQIYQELIR